ncbi:MAG TPA: hypothetical protein VK448_05350 [Dissulfurispiraceae bacterium]|nr:hypothetical protein [Dissulfurispiraceae bacterium]
MIDLDTRNMYRILRTEHQKLCPYHDIASNICTASISSITVDEVRHAGYCSDDNFDDCPIFLSKSLRGR